MGIVSYFVIFVFGLAIGSFLNCVIYRLEQKQSFLQGRSFCPHCKHILSWQDLVPLLSFFILRGRCRYCDKKISLRYPLMEIATGLLFLLIFLPTGDPSQGDNFQTLFWLIISCFLIVIFVYDLKHFIIPDKIIYPAIGIVFIYNVLRDPTSLMRSGLVAILAAGFFLIIVLVSRGRWMGFGDVKLAFLIGLFLGFPNILIALFFAFLIGAIIGVGLILAKRKTLKSEVPFGPFLVTGTFIALFWGPTIIDWYLNFVTYNL